MAKDCHKSAKTRAVLTPCRLDDPAQAHGGRLDQFAAGGRVRRLDEMVSAGDIGALADDFISFGGYQPALDRVIDETIPAIVREVKVLGADAALLVPA